MGNRTVSCKFSSWIAWVSGLPTGLGERRILGGLWSFTYSLHDGIGKSLKASTKSRKRINNEDYSDRVNNFSNKHFNHTVLVTIFLTWNNNDEDDEASRIRRKLSGYVLTNSDRYFALLNNKDSQKRGDCSLEVIRLSIEVLYSFCNILNNMEH